MIDRLLGQILMEEAGTPQESGGSTLLGATQEATAPQTPEAEQPSTQQAPETNEQPSTLLGATGKTGEEGSEKSEEVKQDAKQVEAFEINGLDTMQYAEGEIEELKAICKEKGINAQTATELLKWQAKYAERNDEAIGKRVTQEIQEYVAQEAKKNIELVRKEWGANKATIAQNEADVARVVNTFADDDFRQLMNETGIGNNPAMVRFVLKIGKAIANDRFIGGNRGGGEADTAHRMFPGYDK